MTDEITHTPGMGGERSDIAAMRQPADVESAKPAEESATQEKQ